MAYTMSDDHGQLISYASNVMTPDEEFRRAIEELRSYIEYPFSASDTSAIEEHFMPQPDDSPAVGTIITRIKDYLNLHNKKSKKQLYIEYNKQCLNESNNRSEKQGPAANDNVAVETNPTTESESSPDGQVYTNVRPGEQRERTDSIYSAWINISVD